MRARDEEPLDPRDLGGVPQEEDVDAADAAERVEEDPAEQPNYTEEHPDAIERTVKES
jgi:hypothetical protein